VDKLITTTEVVVKPVGTILGKTFGVLGATVLGNGRQGMVINPVLMLRHYNDYVKNIDIVDNVKETKKAKKDTITVMVVDDSITVRRATTKVLEKYNYNIVLGKDGEDALEQLQLVIPDIILSDIEMPRMDGFEFAKNVRNIEKYSHIPIIMITSRTADKHKKMAFDLGVNDFLGKPYKEEELIEKIKLLTNVNV
jgi:chemosensory pili system protein ChpA (sensor histidine kinase/response regulator)